MLPRERIIAVLNNEKPDYIPLFPKISFASSAYKEETSLLDYMYDYHAMAECLIEAAERQLMPQAELLCEMMDNPNVVHKLLERCLDFSSRLAVALIEAGSDAVSFGHAAASCTVISPDFYREFALLYEKRLIKRIHDAGGIAITHICGKIHRIAEDIKKNGSDVIDCDHMCSVLEMIEKTGRVIRGNLNPALLATGTPQQVYEETRRLLEEVKDVGHFWLGTGCEINLGTPRENIEAMAQARMDWGRVK